MLHQQGSRVTRWAWVLGLGTSLALPVAAYWMTYLALGTPIVDAKPVPSRPPGPGLGAGGPGPLPTKAVPEVLVSLFQQWDQDLSQRKLSPALALYAPTFTHGDGLTRQTLGPAIEQFWQLYPSATYRTTITNWTSTAQGWTVETETRITGRRTDNKRQLALDSLQQLRTTIENGKLLRQEVLGERNRVTSGDAPPTLDMRLDPEVQTNQDFSLDVIVQEPLQNDVLLGAVSDDPVLPGKISDVAKLDLKPLIDSKSGTGPGGIFKIGRASAKAESRWISAIVLRKTGMTFLTQRLRVVDRLSKPAAKPDPKPAATPTK
jgi:hypothetical protein